jgi:hypothetical protein
MKRTVNRIKTVGQNDIAQGGFRPRDRVRDMEGDTIYFSRRAGEERTAAMKAAHPAARQAHLDLAGRYDDLAQSIAAQDRTVLAGITRRQSDFATV